MNSVARLVVFQVVPEGLVDILFRGAPRKYVPVGLDERRPWRSTPPEKDLNLTLF